MKFKHTFHVFVDNFSVIYKQLLYRLIIAVIAFLISWGCLTPFITEFINSQAFNSLTSGIGSFISELLQGHVDMLAQISSNISVAYEQVLDLLNTRMTQIVLTAILLLFVYIVQKWFTGLGNYTTAVIINDKMALRKTSPFINTLISHFKEAAIYNLIYAPLTVLYDVAIAVALIAVLFFMLNGMGYLFISIFLFMLIMIASIGVKMTFTCDWLPALIRGKMGQKKSIIYTFSRKNKNTINVYSNFIVLELIILAINVMAFFFTLGVGLLITIPASYVILLCFEMVNYYDSKELKYFLDKYTIIKSEKERVITREQFFRGDDSDED